MAAGGVYKSAHQEGRTQICSNRTQMSGGYTCVCEMEALPTRRNFFVITDHLSLKWLLNMKNPRDKLARWVVEIQDYAFTIEHRAGPKLVVPDALSRDAGTKPLCQRSYCPVDRMRHISCIVYGKCWIRTEGSTNQGCAACRFRRFTRIFGKIEADDRGRRGDFKQYAPRRAASYCADGHESRVVEVCSRVKIEWTLQAESDDVKTGTPVLVEEHGSGSRCRGNDQRLLTVYGSR